MLAFLNMEATDRVLQKSLGKWCQGIALLNFFSRTSNGNGKKHWANAAATRGKATNPTGMSREAASEAGTRGITEQRKFRRPSAGSVLPFLWQPQRKAKQFSSCFGAWITEAARTPSEKEATTGKLACRQACCVV